MSNVEMAFETTNLIERVLMKKSLCVLFVLFAGAVIVRPSVAAEDDAAKKNPAKSKWVQTMEKTFKTLDKDAGGFLSFDEYKGKRKKSEAIEKAEQIFKLIDVDNDLKVTMKEFTNKPPAARFKQMDRNDDGKIGFDEYKGKREKPEEIEAAEQRFKNMDKDGDKKLSEEEFTAAVKKQQQKKPAKKKFQPHLLEAAGTK